MEGREGWNGDGTSNLPVFQSSTLRDRRKGSMKDSLTHFDEKGNTQMVNVGGKDETLRIAVARGHITARSETLRLIAEQGMKKGNVLEVARLAGIMAAKRTGELIPLCHPLALTSIRVELAISDDVQQVEIEAEVQTVGRTGVEMEALTAVSVAALTVYDMCKAVDRGMVIGEVRLVQKTGGKSGTFTRDTRDTVSGSDT